MAKRLKAAGDLGGLDEKTSQTIAQLSVRALEGRALAGADELELSQCAEALEALAWPDAATLERLQLWLGDEHATAKRRARWLRSVLEACATVAACADTAQTGSVMGALQRLAYFLAELVEGRLQAAPHAERDASGSLLQSLRHRLGSVPQGQIALLLVHCAAIDQIDAARGLRAGEALITKIAGALRGQALRASDTVEIASRDEFACLLHPMPSEGVAILAAQKILRVLDAPLDLEDSAVAADPKVGIALYPEHGKDADQLLQHAKAAMRNARAGHDRIAIYRADTPGAEFDESRYAARLRHAIQSNSGLQLVYQGQADLRSGRLVGAEALLRWQDEQLGAVPPNIAVAVAESSGLMDDLTMWVISSAIQQCVAFRALEPAFTVSVNISPSNLHEADLPAYVGRALRTWDVSSKALILEVTETAIMRDQKLALEALNEISRLGVSIAIDEFGTGYSSMYYLAQMPLDELKIDIMFVRQMLELPQHAKIVRSLIDLAHNLELTVVAEGVENEPIWSALQHLSCERAQGWFVGKPGPAAELIARLRNNPTLPTAKPT